tara:strand:+ start:291 stop:518 length:228 start_codon:yes stop_codon:yes gene_type:complete
MGYHDRDTFEKRWNTKSNNLDREKKDSNPPRVQIISPQKKLYDIQQVLNNLSEQSVLTTDDLKVKIQLILDGQNE